VNRRALDLADALRGQLGPLPGALSLSIREMRPWTFVRIGMASDDALRALAVDLELDQARTERRGRIWWRQVSSRSDGLLVIGAGPYREGEP
jgi:hypothetical protein